jgi:hypothetical protein
VDDDDPLDLAKDVFDFTITGAEGFSRLGHAIAAGDVNGDGSGDLVVGAPFAGRPPGSAPGSERTALGEAYVILGNSDLAGEWNVARGEYDSLLSGAIAFGEFGSAIAVGDLNNDDRDDIVAGAHRSSVGDPARPSSGAAYVFYGQENLPERLSTQDGDEDVSIVGKEGATLGYPLTVGDYNGDSTSDIAIGGQLETTEGGAPSAGGIHIFYGDDDLPSEIDLAETTADVFVVGREQSEFLPSSIASTDLDADGRSELVIGSMLVAADDDRFGAGVVYLTSVPEGAEAIDLTRDAAIVLGEAAGDRLGNAVAAGDSVALAAPLADGDNRPDSGVVYLLSFSQ